MENFECYYPLVVSTQSVTTETAELNKHLYFPVAPAYPSRNAVPLSYFFVAEDVRADLERRASSHCIAPSNLPETVHCYHSLAPLEPPSTYPSRFFRHFTCWYKGINQRDGETYAICRLCDYKLPQQNLLTVVVDSWSHISHPNITKLHEAFTTSAFGNQSLCLVYDFIPGASPLSKISFHPSNPMHLRTLWSYLLQMLTVIGTLHEKNLCLRCIDPSKVLVISERLRINAVGALDFLESSELDFQADYLALGNMFVSILGPVNQATRVLSKWPTEFCNAILNLLDDTRPKSHTELISMYTPIVIQELNALRIRQDMLEEELMKSLENGRVARLLMKILFVIDRSEQWSETGDRYFVKLFRDYCFHTVDTNGKPVVDVGHVISCLNKLDAGSTEKIMLTSTDGRNCLIVSYEELKRCIQDSFQELFGE